MLDTDNTALIVIDIQGKLASLVHEHRKVLRHIEYFVKAAQVLDIPVICTEQAPDKIGPTVDSVKELLKDNYQPIHKRSFSCYACPEFVEELRKLNKSKIIVTGIETHVCVYQTVHDLTLHGFEVQVVADAVSARKELDHNLALSRMRHEGVVTTSMEMAMCELIKSADHPKFRDVIAHLKN